MERDHNFGKYILSSKSEELLKENEHLFKSNSYDSKQLIWRELFNENQNLAENQVVDQLEIDVKKQPNLEHNNEHESQEFEVPSSQFFFTQVNTVKKKPKINKTNNSSPKLNDVIENICESLEKSTETFDINCIKNVNDSDLIILFKGLSNKISISGCYNLCNSVCDVETEIGAQYIELICTEILVQKIIDLQEESRIISTIIHKLCNKYPRQVQKCIFIPIINADLLDNSIITSIIRKFTGNQRMNLISDFLSTVKELKNWHIEILPILFDIKIENDMKDRLIKLLLDKAVAYSKDLNYTQFTISFIKLNSPFTNEQKNMLNEIAIINESSVYKNVLKIVINNLTE